MNTDLNFDLIFALGSRLSLSSHKKRHSQTFYCDQCEYSTWNKLLLKSHSQTKHDKVKALKGVFHFVEPIKSLVMRSQYNTNHSISYKRY